MSVSEQHVYCTCARGSASICASMLLRGFLSWRSWFVILVMFLLLSQSESNFLFFHASTASLLQALYEIV